MSRTLRHGWKYLFAVLFAASVISLGMFHPARAITDDGFSLQVSPSPLVTTLKPGQNSELELTIRNLGAETENLKIEPRSFSLNNATGVVALSDSTPAEITPWISFGQQKFTVQPGALFTQKVRISLPKDTGFSYSLALVISRQNTPEPTNGGRLIEASVAVFTLINVDRPGATRKLDMAEITADKKVYEYLPTKFDITFKNSGNTIVQPYGNIYIQRSSDDKSPIQTLPVNETKGYILPGSSRTLTSSWSAGFPVIETDEQGKARENWDWSKVSNIRFGQYTAKLVGVYNDGQRDIPLVTEVTFWVIPWKILLGLFVILLLVGIGIWSLVRKVYLVIKRKASKISNGRSGLQE